MLRFVVVAASLGSAASENPLQYEEITKYATINSYGTNIFVSSDIYTDFAWYDTEEDCKNGEGALVAPVNAWRVDRVIDPCVQSGTECYKGVKIAGNEKISMKITGKEDSIEFQAYAGDKCEASVFPPRPALVPGGLTLDAEERKDFASGRSLKATIVGFTYWGRLEVRKTCELPTTTTTTPPTTTTEPPEEEQEEEGNENSDGVLDGSKQDAAFAGASFGVPALVAAMAAWASRSLMPSRR